MIEDKKRDNKNFCQCFGNGYIMEKQSTKIGFAFGWKILKQILKYVTLHVMSTCLSVKTFKDILNTVNHRKMDKENARPIIIP